MERKKQIVEERQKLRWQVAALQEALENEKRASNTLIKEKAILKQVNEEYRQNIEKKEIKKYPVSREINITNKLLTCCEKCLSIDLEVNQDIDTLYAESEVLDRAIEIKIDCRHREVCKRYIDSNE